MKYAFDISVVISNFNTKNFLKKTLHSLQRSLEGVSWEIIVVDDSSTDGSFQMVEQEFPKVKLVRNLINQGYSKSYNIGTSKAKGEFILHLNSDVIFDRTSKLRTLLDYMRSNKDIGIAGCRIIKPDGKLDLPCKRSFPTPSNIIFQSIGLSHSYYLTHLNERKTHEIDCIMGAFMFIRKQVIDNTGLLDEQFYIYGEDIDYCLRAKTNGWKIVYFSSVTIQHFHGGTTRNARWKHIWLFHLAMILYFNKHYKNKQNFLLNFIVYSGIILRFITIISIEMMKLLVSI